IIELDVIVRENTIEETRRAAVSVVGDDDVFACFDQSQGCVDCGHAGSECESETCSFKRSDVSFYCGTCRVLSACVLVAFVLSECVLRVRRGLIDRDGNRAGALVRFRSGVYCSCGESHNIVLCTLYFVLCTLYFVLCTLSKCPNQAQSTKNKALSTNF